MLHSPGGVHGFLRAYYHHKSADWPANKPHPLKGWTAAELAKLPTYYVMDLDKTMAETVAAEAPTEAEISAAAPRMQARHLVTAGASARATEEAQPLAVVEGSRLGVLANRERHGHLANGLWALTSLAAVSTLTRGPPADAQGSPSARPSSHRSRHRTQGHSPEPSPTAP